MMTEKEIKKLTYEEALEKLQEISERLEKKEVDVDNLTKEVSLANALSKYCREKLEKTEKEISKILDVGEESEESENPPL